MTLLFVYGTLRRDAAGRSHPLLGEDAEWRGKACWPGRLYRVADYPGAVASADPSDRVHGELYALPQPPDAVLAALDAWEDCDTADPEYRRERALVRRDDGSRVEAWIYVYARPVAGLARIISGDFGPGGSAPTLP